MGGGICPRQGRALFLCIVLFLVLGDWQPFHNTHLLDSSIESADLFAGYENLRRRRVIRGLRRRETVIFHTC